MAYNFVRTKIIATIGPASSGKAVLKKMFESGLDVCRLNFSHGKHEEYKTIIETIRELNKEMDLNISILGDLQGPKLRIGEVENNAVLLEEGQEFNIITSECIGTKQQAFMTYKKFPSDVAVGDEVLIDDGKIKLKVVNTNMTDTVKTTVVNGGVLSSRKGVNLPDTKISLPSLTEKDKTDLDFILAQNLDWVALSFVRTVTDIVEIKEIIRKKKKHTRVIAKIEKPEAINEIDNIIDMTDAVMVARGDLGVEIPFDKVPVIQKSIVKKCIENSKPVIIATQMLESMITTFRPTRAEATDCANAVTEGADCLMLSGETSAGKFPVETVAAMNSIIKYTEDNSFNFNRFRHTRELSRTFLPDSICNTACQLAEAANATAIITFSHSGYTAFQIAARRPKAQIFVFTNNRELISGLSLVWGLTVFYVDTYNNIDDATEHSIKFLIEKQLLKNEDIVVHAASTPLHEKGRTNMVKLSYVKA